MFLFWNRARKEDERFRINRAIASAETAGFNRGLQWAEHKAKHGCEPPESRVERIQRMHLEGLLGARESAQMIADLFLKVQP